MQTDIGFAADRFIELGEKMSDPQVMSDPEALAGIMREYKRLEPIASKINALRELEKAVNEADAIIEANEDAELTQLALAEKEDSLSRIEQIKSQIEEFLHQPDGDENASVIVEIRGGAGGEEAALFASSVYRMYSMYAAKRGWHIDVVNANPTELGGYKEISFIVEGEGAYKRLKYESGVHRVQRVPETESGGRIHTSTVTVAVLREAEEVSVEIRPEDISIDTFRSSGAGGQHINKTESAIRITHKPTGLVVECQDERSQYKNKDKAMKVLRSKLYDMELSKQQAAVADDRRSQVGTGDRSERIRTYNFPQSRVTDHRIGLTLYKLDSVLNGDMDIVIDGLIEADNANKLKNDAT